MANRADVFFKNFVGDDMMEGQVGTKDIKVNRLLPDGQSDQEITVAYGNRSTERIHLPGPEVSLVIRGPEGMNMTKCPFKVLSDVDLSITYSVSGCLWEVKLQDSSLPPTAPLTVNIELGDVEPED
ncbi:MAG: hypothetical protein GY940_47305 [bacterium]|nr:hypothetical protein [bacterium]